MLCFFRNFRFIVIAVYPSFTTPKSRAANGVEFRAGPIFHDKNVVAAGFNLLSNTPRDKEEDEKIERKCDKEELQSGANTLRHFLITFIPVT